MAMTMVTAILGASVDTGVLPPIVHGMIAYAAVAANSPRREDRDRRARRIEPGRRRGQPAARFVSVSHMACQRRCISALSRRLGVAGPARSRLRKSAGRTRMFAGPWIGLGMSASCRAAEGDSIMIVSDVLTKRSRIRLPGWLAVCIPYGLYRLRLRGSRHHRVVFRRAPGCAQPSRVPFICDLASRISRSLRCRQARSNRFGRAIGHHHVGVDTRVPRHPALEIPKAAPWVHFGDGKNDDRHAAAAGFSQAGAPDRRRQAHDDCGPLRDDYRQRVAG